jgi:LysM repeat protein
MPKDSVVAKYLKRTAVVLILSLAVVGLFSVLRKAPKVHIPEEDRSYIGEIFGRAEFESSGNPSEGGVSSLMDFGVSGAPSVGGNSSGTTAPSKAIGSTALSNLIQQSDAPVYSDSPSNSSEAPAFIAVPTTSIPKSSTMSDAPLFANQQPALAETASAIPALKVPAGLEATPAPVYGSQYQIPQNQIPQTQKPVQQTPAQQAPPIPVSAPDVPAIPTVQPPSEILQKTTTFVPTAPPDLYVQPPAWDGPAEPLLSAVIATAANAQFPSVNEPQGNFAALAPQSFSSTDAYLIAVIQDTTAVPVAIPQNTEKQVVFTPPPFKHLPQVAEDYYQTSIKNTEQSEAVKSAAMVLAPPRSASQDEAAKVSFSPQMEKPQKSQTQEIAAPIKTLIVSEPSIVEIETIPFTSTPAAVTSSTVKTTAAEEQLVQQVSAVSSPSNESLENVIRFIDSQCREADTGNPEQLRNAFIQLSRLYNRKELGEAERNHLVPILSRIGVDVIFSRSRHILEPAYIVKEGDTVDSVAAAFQISPELLMKINGLTGARPLRTGTPLKVVHGQFDAHISTAKGQFVLILGGLYAGQFQVAAGKDVQNIRGEFYVAEKTDSYRGKTLMLNNGVVLCSGVQGSNKICFTDKDANELFDILTENSVIVFE